MRRKLYTAKHRVVGGEGGRPVPESSSNNGKSGLVQLWPLFLDQEFQVARPSLSMPDVKHMIDCRETPRYHDMPPRQLSDAEVDAINTWYEAAARKQSAALGAKLAAVQNNIAAQLSVNHEQNAELHSETGRRIETTRADLSAQIG